MYLQRLTKSGTEWRASSRIRVNNEETTYESDQFVPALTVDEEGYVHIVFYDDRRFTDPDDPNDPEEDQQPDSTEHPKYDAYYAWAPIGNLNFNNGDRNVRLYLDHEDPADPPALDWGLLVNEPREYIGITWYNDSIWMTYPGTDSGDPQANDSVVWSTRVNWVTSP